jgi:hypothetical protein
MHRWGRIHFGGPSVLYLLRRACMVTPYVFPDHLATFREGEAIGVPPPAAVAAAMARRPQIVIAPEAAEADHTNLASRAVLLAALARDYRAVARRPFKRSLAGRLPPPLSH